METLQRTANRGSISTGFEIENSLKFEPDNSEILKRTYGSGGNVQKWTFSTWIKRTELAGCRLFGLKTNGNVFLQLSGDKLRWYVNGNDQYTEAVYRDTAAWYHIILQFDSTQATASNRTKIYVNGVQQTLTGSYVGQNTSAIINGAVIHGLGGREDNNTEIFAGYMAETYFIDNQALEPSDFGEYDSDSGIWKPKEYEGTFGTTGWYLDFEDAANLGDDVSGNNNDWTETNITAADQATDTPTNNFCTLNQAAFTLTDATISQGATSFFNTVSSTRTAVATMAVTKGKWYFEYKFISTGGSTYWPAIGFTNAESTSSSLSAGVDSDSSTLLLPNGTPYENGTIGSSNFSFFTTNDIAGVALDVDNGNMYLYKNGTIQNSGNPVFTSIGDFIMPLGTTYQNGCGGYFNFGGFTSYTPASAASDENGYGTFEYAPPSGYYALCTKNLAEYG